MGLLDGKVVFITGGARAQGRAHAIASAREGADIAFVDIARDVDSVPYSMATADDIADTIKAIEALDRRALGIEADVRSQEQLDAAVNETLATFGHIDSIIANAGVWSSSPFWEMGEQQWSEMIDINLTGAWKSVKAVTPHMIARKSGSIVMISSVNGIEPGLNYAHYTASKFGLNGLMKTIALELAPYGIRCNGINPGAVRSGISEHQEALDMYAGHPGGTLDDLVNAGRSYGALRGSTFMDPATIANAALFLNSDMAANVTGSSIPVESGHLLIPGINNSPVIDQ